ncbi:MAG: ROK family protein [Bacteroidales bacterium]|jgi:glucokinase
MYRYAAAIGADIARLSLRVAVIRMGGEPICEDSFPLKADQDREYILSELNRTINLTREKVAANGVNPIAIGISARGFIDHERGVVLGPGHGIKDWTNVPLAKIVSRETGLPVFVGNDANLMTVAEQRYGAAHGYKNIVFVALRAGIGGGIVINGSLYRGVNNAGGEIGQMIINFTGDVSETGIKGSFEHFASASALVRRYLEEKGIPKESGNMISAREIFELSYRRDRTAVKVVTENAKLVGIGLSNLITIFAPEIIVLGGGMAEARDSYIDMIRESAFSNSLENCRAEVKIERAALGSRSALIGAAVYSLTRLAGQSI